MLFNSHVFLFLFLPVTVLVFFRVAGRGHHQAAVGWLVAASFFFYGWWNPAYVVLLVFSIVFNYAYGMFLYRTRRRVGSRRWLLGGGVAVNLALIAYYKYAGFLVANLGTLLDRSFQIDAIILPLAISFFTFQQITYLVDASRGETREYRFLHYCLFVTFFPQLIAGPIVHHKEMLPQFARNETFRVHYSNLAVGLTIFFIGLIKKVLLADNVAHYVSPVFAAAAQGHAPGLQEAWVAALAYSFQLYFDFSGYSDMAIGLARLFGIKLPLNFNSPYKARNIVDFWRRWHITLSRFLRDYVYIPLGGNRKGPARRYGNILLTMLIGGLWHGAGWTFVLWGGLHGIFLVLNHLWHGVSRGRPRSVARGLDWRGWLARLSTFLLIVMAWVPFRAESFDAAWSMLLGMWGVNGFAAASDPALAIELGPAFRWILGLFLLCQFAPNTQQLLARFRPALRYPSSTSNSPRLEWRLSWPWAVGLGTGAAYAILNLVEVSEFLYFQF